MEAEKWPKPMKGMTEQQMSDAAWSALNLKDGDKTDIGVGEIALLLIKWRQSRKLSHHAMLQALQRIVPLFQYFAEYEALQNGQALEGSVNAVERSATHNRVKWQES